MPDVRRSLELLAISGSLRQRSSNTELLRAAALLAPDGVTIRLYDELDKLPHFNPDFEDSLPDVVQTLRRRVGLAAGLLICSPEYARGVAGSFKNALDWLVGGSEFVGKPVALLNASPRATHANAALRVTLQTMSAHFVDAASITVPLLGANLDAAGIVANSDMAGRLRAALEAFRQAIDAQSAAAAG
jgi:chromate reductase, NAD(P)H dehydrogenase (quinone)